MTAIFWLIDAVLGLAKFFLIANVIASWLVAFGIINSYQPFVRTVLQFLHGVTEPIVRPIRRFIPPVNGIDLSTIVAILAIIFLQIFIGHDLRNAMMG